MVKSKKKILIVEDEAILRETLEEKFSHENFIVHTAPDGAVGCKLALELHPDIILLDLIMPKMDGMEVLKKLRSDNWGSHARVIILTNVNNADKVAEGLKIGGGEPYDYLIKTDWSLDDVVKKVKEKLKR